MIRIIGGTHRGRSLKTLSGRETRPTKALVRKALFDIAGSMEGKRVLDLFSGTGAMAFEALSRGARDAVAIERSGLACRMIAENTRRLEFGDRLTLVSGDVAKILAAPDAEATWVRAGVFDLVYADPPYSFDDWPAMCDLAARFLAPGGILALEHAPDVSLPACPSFPSRRDYRYGDSVISVMKAAVAG